MNQALGRWAEELEEDARRRLSRAGLSVPPGFSERLLAPGLVPGAGGSLRGGGSWCVGVFVERAFGLIFEI
ncbi:MAG TPA: hypothetical protein ENK13_01530, partial [Thermopetrobacter sp.]|nr:hypothetical protein [Thermopetrobacter sp.]